MSPGASFLLATRVALSSSFSTSLGVAIGLGGGAMIFALIALSGLHALLSVIPALHTVLKVLGGGYLLWSAAKILLQKPRARANDSAIPTLTFTQALFSGLFTQLSNPNTAIVFASLFTTLLDHHLSITVYITVPVMTFFIDFVWFTLVALILSHSLPRCFYLRGKVTIDRITAGILGLLGLKLLLK
ncbi:LysE family transporter [Rosenbergiella sp. S61]|uniref:LysE family transporter n=2 Tax=Rosenbergiella gaditana TaxID=2726987 RepID=A0ABS5SWM6_9GAMM|nr:LysE family transporter [Rosenbergiella gaditana]MBT0724496.1 LysE family transporter [Rosenbergiella gaditana]